MCFGHEGLVANQVPFFLDRSRGQNDTLIEHVSRANTVWRELGPTAPSVVKFRRSRHDITPGWYPGKAQHGMVVPTWNHVAAHAHGVARAIEDRGWMLDMLNRLTDVHEARGAVPWCAGDAPSSFIDKFLRAIVGIELRIDRLEGKLKASHDEALPDRIGTVRGLEDETADEAGSMVDIVRKAMETEKAGRS